MRGCLAAVIVILAASPCAAQSATYHLHLEDSATSGVFQLKTAAPDSATLAITSANLANQPTGEYIVKAFDTQSGVPNASGLISAGSTVTADVWMRKTGLLGAMVPRIKVHLNNAAGAQLCAATGSTALTNTLAKYTLTCTTASELPVVSTDRFYLWVGVNLTTTPLLLPEMAELNVEGTPSGNYDSLVVIPLPLAPTIDTLNPTSGQVGGNVTITGSRFGSVQGTSTVTFNGTVATPTVWGPTSIQAPVPSGATTGPVIVTVSGAASNGVGFTVTVPTSTITGSITRQSDGQPVPGATVQLRQGGAIVSATTTNASGAFAISSVPPGTYDLRVISTNFALAEQTGLVLSPGGTTTADLQLQTGSVRYVYDGLGRLVSVIAPSGEAATYTYDAVGNLLSIARRSVGDVQIATFTPSSGPVGTSVTIFGVGFSEVAAQNSVSFNGTAATVTSAAATQLVVTVPAGATTGAITVVTPTGSSTSATAFVVAVPAIPPTISGFTPTIGLAGTAVTVTGTGFDPVTSNDRLTFNGPRVATVSNATQIELQTAVPTAATSGRLTIKTPGGSAMSEGDFFVPPSPHTPSDVDVATRVTFGQQQTVGIATAGHIGLLLFDGAPGRRISMSTGQSNPNGSYQVFHPVGAAVATEWPGWSFMDAVSVPTAGTYTLMVDPYGSATGNFALTVYDVPADTSGAMSIEGPPVTVTTTTPGQNAYVQFSGTAGQHVGVQLSGVTVPSFYWGIRQADLHNLSAGDDYLSDDDPAAIKFLDVVLPQNGTYTVWFDPEVENTGSITAAATGLPADIVETITPGGPPVSVSITTPGQNARLTFNGQAGQRVAILFSSYSLPGSTRASLLGPNGIVVLPAAPLYSGGDYRDTVALPVAGTYTILIDPLYGHTGNITTTLYDVPPDPSGTLTIGAPGQGVTLVAGQNASLTFSGSAGQRVALQMSGVTIAQTTATIRNPDGSVLGQTTVWTSGGAITDKTLPVTGTFTVTIDPYRNNAGTMTLTLFDAGDVLGTITPGGPSVTVTITAPGQNARLSFEGAAGQKVSVTGSSVTVTSTEVSVLKPDGTTLGSTTSFTPSGGNFLDTKTLPQAGTHTLFLNPFGGYTGTLTVTLHNVVDVTGLIAMGGGTMPVTLTTPGQTARLTFDASANQQVSLRATSVSGAFGNLAILRPDETTLVSASIFNSSGAFIDKTTLPVAGTYTALVDPSVANVGSLNLALYDATDVSGSVTVNGGGFTVSITAPGQNGALTFSGTAGQQVTVRVTGNTAGSTTVKLFRPDGTQQTTSTSSASNFNLSQQTLATNGTYTISIDPAQANTGSLTISVTNP